MRKLYEQDIIEILYGATLLGAGGGGSLKQGLGMLDGLKKDGNAIEVDLLDLDEIGDNEYAAVVCGLGSPVAMLDPSKPAFAPMRFMRSRPSRRHLLPKARKSSISSLARWVALTRSLLCWWLFCPTKTPPSVSRWWTWTAMAAPARS